MKKKILNIITVLIAIVTICIIVHIVYDVVKIIKLKDPNSIESFIAIYENEPSNRHLIGLCNKLSLEKDKRFFKYFDDFMNMENFNGEIKNYENGNITDAEIDFCHDFMITGAFKICVKNNDIDLLTETMLKYYPQIRDKDKLFYLALANDGSAEATAFFQDNAEKLVEVLEKFYTEADNPKLKLRYLLEINTYYYCDEVQNYDLFKEKYYDEFTQLREQCVSDSDVGKIAVLSGYFKSYWEHLLTGEDNPGWNSAYNEMWSKYEEAGVTET